MDNRMTITRKQKWEGKPLYGRFKRLISNIPHNKTWIWLRKGNFKRETESLLVAAQNNAIRTDHIKAKIDKTQQNSKCTLWWQYMHNPAPVLENNTHQLLWDFDIYTDHLISTRRPDLIVINNKKDNLQNCGLCCPDWLQIKTERMWKKDKYLDLAWELKNYGTCRWQVYQL